MYASWADHSKQVPSFLAVPRSVEQRSQDGSRDDTWDLTYYKAAVRQPPCCIRLLGLYSAPIFGSVGPYVPPAHLNSCKTVPGNSINRADDQARGSAATSSPLQFDASLPAWRYTVASLPIRFTMWICSTLTSPIPAVG